MRKYKCDVCWTCRWFNHNHWICIDGSHIILKAEPGLIITNYIKKPEQTSCPYWSEKNEKKEICD